MNARDAQKLIEKLKSLPPQRQAEVEDFADFLRSREDDQRLVTAAARASEPGFAVVWETRTIPSMTAYNFRPPDIPSR